MPPITVIAATPQLAEKADDLVLTNVEIGNDGEVSCEVANTSKQTVGDVELQILYSWRWQDEFHPGKDDPGRAVYVTVDREIAPARARHSTISLRRLFPAEKTGTSKLALKLLV